MAHYMLLLHQDPKILAQQPPQNLKEIVERYYAWADELRQKRKYVGGEKLTVGRVRHIRMRDGKPLSSDGPYAEAKDVVGGYFIIEAKDDAEADMIARDCPHLWNATNWVELRPIDHMTAEEFAKAVG